MPDMLPVIVQKSLEGNMLPKLAAALPACGDREGVARRLVQLSMTAFKNPKLLAAIKANPESALLAVMEAAELGLMPDSIRGQAYYVPYRSTIQLIVGYRGLQELAMRSGKVSSILADVAHENDEFTYREGTNPFLNHVKALSNRGKPIATYAVAHMTDGSPPAFVILDEDETEAIRKRSPAGDNGPWKTDRPEMKKKSAIRRLGKNLPLSPELVKAATKGEYYQADVLDVGQRKRTGKDYGFPEIGKLASREGDGQPAVSPPDASAAPSRTLTPEEQKGKEEMAAAGLGDEEVDARWEDAR